MNEQLMHDKTKKDYRPGLQLTPSSKLMTSGPGQSEESSDTQVPTAWFSSSRPSELRGMLNLT